MKLVTVVGARPQFIKAATVSRLLDSGHVAGLEELLVHTGQHYDPELSKVFFEQLGIPTPHLNLAVGSHSPSTQTGRMLEALDGALREIRPDRVLVYGDTNSTLAGALAAAHLGIPVAHVEAGLRSFERSMPEEINRVLTDRLADILFCPTPVAVENLRREGITDGVHHVGDVMYDCVRLFRDAMSRADTVERLGLEPREYFLATVHRAENTDDPSRLRSIVAALGDVSDQSPVVWPVHPRAREAMRRGGIPEPEGVRSISPLPYIEFQALIADARCVLTDSGGLQKEAYFHRVPCVTLRDVTEWTETVEHGFNVLAGADRARIVSAAISATFPSGDGVPELYGGGHAAEAIVNILAG